MIDSVLLALPSPATRPPSLPHPLPTTVPDPLLSHDAFSPPLRVSPALARLFPAPEFNAFDTLNIYPSTAHAIQDIRFLELCPFLPTPKPQLPPHPDRTLLIWTDGSHAPDSPTGGCGVFTLNPPSSVPRLVAARTRAQSSADAEFHAVFFALLTSPLNYNIHIHTDSMTVIHSSRLSFHHINAPLLQRTTLPYILHLHNIIRYRSHFGSATLFTHVKSHTLSTSLQHLGNSIADWLATIGRVHGRRLVIAPLSPPHPPVEPSRPLADVLDGARRAAHRLHTRAWLLSPSQHAYLHAVPHHHIAEWLSWLRSLSHGHFRLISRIVTSTLGTFSYLAHLNPTQFPSPLCPRCLSQPETIPHVFSCPRLDTVTRRTLHDCVPLITSTFDPQRTLTLTPTLDAMQQVWRSRVRFTRT